MNAMVRELELDEITAVSGAACPPRWVPRPNGENSNGCNGSGNNESSGDNRPPSPTHPPQGNGGSSGGDVSSTCQSCHTPPNDGIHSTAPMVSIRPVALGPLEINLNAIANNLVTNPILPSPNLGDLSSYRASVNFKN